MIKDRRAGFFSFRVDEDGLYIDNIQIGSEFQGLGIGTNILEQFFAEHPQELVRLTTFKDNPALRLYERLGFEVTAEEGFSVKMERRSGKYGGV